MSDLAILRDFRLVDKGLNLRSGGTLTVDDQYFRESSALRAAMKAGWIDLQQNVKSDDSRFVRTIPVAPRKPKAIQPVVEQDDVSRQARNPEASLKVTPALKKTVDPGEAREQALKRAQRRMQRLKSGETPIGTGVSFKSSDAADEVVGVDQIDDHLQARQQRRIEAEREYQISMKKKAEAKLPPLSSKGDDTDPVVATGADEITEVGVETREIPGESLIDATQGDTETPSEGLESKPVAHEGAEIKETAGDDATVSQEVLDDVTSMVFEPSPEVEAPTVKDGVNRKVRERRSGRRSKRSREQAPTTEPA